MLLNSFADYTFRRLVQAGMHPNMVVSETGTMIEVSLPVLGMIYLDFGKDTVNLAGMEGKGVCRWLYGTLFPHIKVKYNKQVYAALQQFLWERFKPEDIEVHLGVALVVVIWNYVKLSSESIEPVIKAFCESRGRTYDLDYDRFYVNITEVSWQ